MTKSVIIEAENLEDARAQVKSQIPEGLHLLSEQVLSDGKPKIVKVTGKTMKVAFAEAQILIPANATIIEKKELFAPNQQAVIEVTYKTRAKVSATIGEKFDKDKLTKHQFTISAKLGDKFGKDKLAQHRFIEKILQHVNNEASHRDAIQTNANNAEKILQHVNDKASAKNGDKFSKNKLSKEEKNNFKKECEISEQCISILDKSETREEIERAFKDIAKLDPSNEAAQKIAAGCHQLSHENLIQLKESVMNDHRSFIQTVEKFS